MAEKSSCGQMMPDTADDNPKTACSSGTVRNFMLGRLGLGRRSSNSLWQCWGLLPLAPIPAIVSNKLRSNPGPVKLARSCIIKEAICCSSCGVSSPQDHFITMFGWANRQCLNTCLNMCLDTCLGMHTCLNMSPHKCLKMRPDRETYTSTPQISHAHIVYIDKHCLQTGLRVLICALTRVLRRTL